MATHIHIHHGKVKDANPSIQKAEALASQINQLLNAAYREPGIDRVTQQSIASALIDCVHLQNKLDKIR